MYSVVLQLYKMWLLLTTVNIILRIYLLLVLILTIFFLLIWIEKYIRHTENIRLLILLLLLLWHLLLFLIPLVVIKSITTPIIITTIIHFFPSIYPIITFITISSSIAIISIAIHKNIVIITITSFIISINTLNVLKITNYLSGELDHLVTS